MKTYHSSQKEEIAAAVNAGGVTITSSGGNEIRVYDDPHELALGIRRRYKTCFVIAGGVLYTPNPKAFYPYLKWSKEHGGWDKVAEPGDRVLKYNDPYNFRLLLGGNLTNYWIPEISPVYSATWF